MTKLHGKYMLGGPGSGKGTQCAKLAAQFKLTHLSTGDLLRAELEMKSSIGLQCEELMKEYVFDSLLCIIN
jgi:adenylate kinase family enzyme